MSYCKYCGKQLADGEKCSCEGAKKAEKNYKKLLIPAAVVIALVIGVMCVVSYIQSSLDLADYILIEGAEGFNGQGVLNYSIDSEALYMDMVDNSAWEKADEDNFEELLTNQISQNEEVDHALKSIELSATKEEGLSNGDKITVTAKFSNTLKYNFSHHFKDASVEYTVEGLIDAITVDPFAEENVKVTFSGFNGQGKASFEVLSEDDAFEYIWYMMDHSENLSNGDEVILRAECNEFGLENIGYLAPEQTEKIFIVDGLEDVYSLADGFPSELLDELCEDTLSSIEFDSYYDVLTEPEIVGAYFLSLVDPSEPYRDIPNHLTMNNGVVIVYQYAYDIMGNYREDWTTIVYPNFSKDSNGNLSYEAEEVEDYPISAENEFEVMEALKNKFREMTVTKMR